MYQITQEHLDKNPILKEIGLEVGSQVEYDPEVVVSREKAIELGIDVERIEYEHRVAELRATLLGVEDAILALKKGVPTSAGEFAGEAIANVMLAYRHAEDARMRLGKVFQALNGGKSTLSR